MDLAACISAFMGVCITSQLYSLTGFLGCPEYFLDMKMLSEAAKARISPMKLAVSLQALNLGIAIPLSLELCPSPI